MRLILIFFAVAACSNTNTKNVTAPETPKTEEVVSPVDATPEKQCEQNSCELDPAGQYSLCLESMEGQCFHYGASCLPQERCLYDNGTSSYKECQRAQDGRCTWGQTCKPKNQCLFDFTRTRHRKCKSFSSGKCVSFGDLCAP